MIRFAFLVPGALLLLLSFYFAGSYASVRLTGGHVTGTISRIDRVSGDDNDTFAGWVKYEVNGKTYDVRDSSSTYPFNYVVGDQVDVYYDSADPEFRYWGGALGSLMIPGFMGLFGLPFFLVGVFMDTSSPGEQHERAMAVHRKQKLQSLRKASKPDPQSPVPSYPPRGEVPAEVTRVLPMGDTFRVFCKDLEGRECFGVFDQPLAVGDVVTVRHDGRGRHEVVAG